jgi:hypothetical protein
MGVHVALQVLLQVVGQVVGQGVYNNMDAGFPVGLVMIVLLIVVIYKSCDIKVCRVHKRLKMGNSHSHNTEGVQGLSCQPAGEFQRQQGRVHGCWLGCSSVWSRCSSTNCSMEQEVESANLTIGQGPSNGGKVGVELEFREVGLGCSGVQT